MEAYHYSLTMEMEIKGIVRNIVIDEQPLALRNAVTHKRDQMAMVYPTNNLNFSFKFSLSLGPTNL